MTIECLVGNQRSTSKVLSTCVMIIRLFKSVLFVMIQLFCLKIYCSCRKNSLLKSVNHIAVALQFLNLYQSVSFDDKIEKNGISSNI